MKRHLQAYTIVLLIYFLPSLIASPTGNMYFISIISWSWVSAVIYLKLIKLRCATILCGIEVLISACAIIALYEYGVLGVNWWFYTNIELLVDSLVALEILVITISLMGAAIGIFGISRYNKRNRPFGNWRADPY